MYFTSCFISETGVFFGAFLGPIFAIILINAVIFVIVIIVVVKHIKRKAVKVQEGSKYKTTLRSMLNIGGVMMLFGLTWVFAAFTVLEATIAFQFLFAIFNSLQGFFIFLFYCVLVKDARIMWYSVLLWLCGKGKACDVTSASDTRARRVQRIAKGDTYSGSSTGGRGKSSTGFSVSTGQRLKEGSLPSAAQGSTSELSSYVVSNFATQDLDVTSEQTSVTPAPDSNAEAESNLSSKGPPHMGYPYSESPPKPSPVPRAPPTERFEQPQSTSLTVLPCETEEGGGTRQLMYQTADVAQEDKDLSTSILVRRRSTTCHHVEIVQINFADSEDEEDEIDLLPPHAQ